MRRTRRFQDDDWEEDGWEEDGAEEIELLSKQERRQKRDAADAEVASAPRTSTDSGSSSDASVSLGLIDRATGRPLFPISSSAKKYGRAGRAGRKDQGDLRKERKYRDEERGEDDDDEDDDGDYDDDGAPVSGGEPPDRRTRVVCSILLLLCAGVWGLTFVVLWFSSEDGQYDTSSPGGSGSGDDVVDAGIVDADVVNPPGVNQEGNEITMEQWLAGTWRPVVHEMAWTSGTNGEDGLFLRKSEESTSGYLRVEDIRSRQQRYGRRAQDPIVLMKRNSFTVDGNPVSASKVWPSPDLKTVLVASDVEKNWRHSYTGKYWLFDVESQKGQPLDPQKSDAKIQLASWSPASDAVVFTQDNNMFIRNVSSNEVKNITKDGGPDVFYGIPDWVYEEEVFHGNSATWWSADGKYIAFLRTNETKVPEFPVQYFLSRPSGDTPPEGEENYPDVVKIKYPKTGAPNPTVDMRFYDVEKNETFSVDIPDDLADDDRLIIEVVWASQGKVLVRETNRESDVLKMVLIDTHSRTGKIVRSENVAEVDGGWVEVSETTRFVPADPDNGRPSDGYIDTVVNNGYEHLAYFTELNSADPVFLTSGDWEVVDSPTAVDLDRGLAYFVATKEATWDRHVYSVKLDGADLQAVTNTSEPGYYDMSFSKGSGYGLISYQGPGIPWQKVISTPANEKNSYAEMLEENKNLKAVARKHAMPLLVYSNVTIDNFTLPVVEQRPPNFNSTKKYPVLFHLYGGPGSQTVDKRFTVNFQTYVASSLEYIVVTVDGRGTGFNGRKARCIIRDNIGHYEARDQIETAKIWGSKPYVDESRMAIWGWSYGGFMALKTLEQDAGRTFQYGMAVAPVTDWQFYDSIYTERYMHTPQNNPDGYEKSTVSNTTALGETTRFLVMHGMSDDNVHIQNSLKLLDNLDLAGVDNYDVHVFPDSAHSIGFHNSYPMVHSRLSDWLVNAFNGEWAKIRDPVPNPSRFRRALGGVRTFWES